MTEPREPETGEGLRVTDRRRVDPVTGAVRGPAPDEPPAPTGVAFGEGADEVDADLDVTAGLVAEVTADLQRVHAEYANYRKRVERDRELVRDLAAAGVLAELLPVLDDIGRAREHGELEGGFRSVGEALEGILQRLGDS